MAAQNAGRECPRSLQPADILGSDLLELGITLIGIIPVGITQSFGFCDIFMSSSFAWVDPAAKTAAAPKQVESRNLRIGISLLTTRG